MKKQYAALLFSFFCISLSFGQNPYFPTMELLSQPPIFGASPFQDSLWAFDRSTFQIVYRSAPQLSGGTLTGINGLTVHPCTDEIYVVYKQSGAPSRMLGIFNPQNDTITEVGALGDNFSSITFSPDGTLYGTVGDGGNSSETLFTIDVTTAATTLVSALGNGADGEVIAYNYDNDRIYHFSGNGTSIFESFPIPFAAPTNISSGLGAGEIFGAVYLGNDTLLISTISSNFRYLPISATTPSAILVSTPDDIRGLGLPGRWINLNGPAAYCAGTSPTTLEAAGGQEYQWTLDGNVIAGATGSTYAPTQSGWYNCLITKDTANCTSSPADTAWFGKQITVFDLPVVDIIPSGNAYLCVAGDSVLLSGTTGGATNQWFMNGASVAGATNDTFYASSPGTYNMYLTDANGCSDSSSLATVVLFAPASAMSPTGSDTICSPATVTLNAAVGADSYQWLSNGNPIVGETSDSYVASTSGIYSCLISFGNCADTTITFDLSVLDCSGLNELNKELMTLYPNPAGNTLVVEVPQYASFSVTVFSADGRDVYSGHLEGTSVQLDISALPRGTYSVQLSNDETTITERFVKL